PNATQIDAHAGATVWKEVRVIAGVTPDDQGPSYPNAVREWCINTAAVDAFTHSVLAGNEDGILYRWNLDSNTFTESVVLTPGIGEAYTPTLVGPDGQVYAINNATLFAVGALNAGVDPGPRATRIGLAFAGRNPSPGGTRLRYTLPVAAEVALDVLDVTGRYVATVSQGAAAAGEHTVIWNGRDASGARADAGLYFARLRVGGETRTLKLVLAR
ncbi:MAG: T9SS type A sorting domain-containing protein, partial [Candidatus Eisenbacteria bacterium]|nr:T9SS type A sorting domain-containing protein [Candidatus Eisenbacteria bacterium]